MPYLVVMQFELTPKALANVSPWLERSDNHGEINNKLQITLKGLGGWRTPSGLDQNFL